MKLLSKNKNKYGHFHAYDYFWTKMEPIESLKNFEKYITFFWTKVRPIKSPIYVLIILNYFIYLL